MGDSPAEQLLLRFGIDLAPIKQSVENVKGMLGELNKLSDTVGTKTGAAVAASKEQFTQIKQQADIAAQLAKTIVAEENQKIASLKTQTAERRLQQEELKTASAVDKVAVNDKLSALKLQTAEYQKQLASKKAESAEIQKQIAEERLRVAAQAGKGSSGSGGAGAHGAGGAGASMIGAVFGGGLAGSVASGVLMGTGLGMAIQAAGHAVTELIHKVRELIVESGDLAKVELQFEAIARGAGVDAAHAMTLLREKTEGEVDKMRLLKVANQALKAPLGLTMEQVAQLSGDIVKLSESSGKSGAQGIDRLTMAFARGRPQMLAFVAGLTAQELRLTNLPPTMNRAQRSAAEWAHAVEVLRKRAEELGEVPSTIEDGIKRVKNAWDDTLKSFAVGINRSGGVQVILEAVTKVALKTGEANGLAEAFGENLARVAALAIPGFKLLAQAVNSVADAFKSALGPTGVFDENMFSLKNEIRETGIFLNALTTLVQAVGLNIKNFAETIWLSVRMIPQQFAVIAAAMKGDVAEVKRLMAEQEVDAKTRGQSLARIWQRGTDELRVATATRRAEWDKYVEDLYAPKEPRENKIKPAKPDNQETTAQRMKDARDRMQFALAQAKLALEEKKDEIAEEKALDLRRYQDGDELLEEHIAKQLDIARRGHEATLAEQKTEFQAQVGMLGEQLKAKTLEQDNYDMELAAKRAAFKRQQAAEGKRFDAEIRGIEDQGRADARATRNREISNELAVEKARIAQLTTLEEKRFAKGVTDPAAYFRARVALIEQETRAEVKNAEDTFEANKKSTDAKKKLEEARVKAFQTGMDRMAVLEEERVDKSLAYIQRKFGPQQQAMETQLAYQQQAGPEEKSSFSVSSGALLRNLQTLAEQQQQELLKMIQTVQPYSDQWFKIYGQIEHAYQSQVKYNRELEKVKDIMPSIGQAFGQLGRAIQDNFHSKFAQNLSEMVTHASGTLAQATERGQRIRGTAKMPVKDPALVKLENEAASLFAGVKSSVDKVQTPMSSFTTWILRATTALMKLAGSPGGSATGAAEGGDETPTFSVTSKPAFASKKELGDQSDSADKVQSFVDRLGAAVDAISSFTTSILGAKSAVGGALSGGMAGAGLGKTISSALGMAGPIGEIAGAIGGAVLGGIVGKKNAEVTRNVNKMNESYKEIMHDFSLNTNNLNNTIQQLELLMNQARTMQASSKKGSAQYQQLIDQYVQQIQQLQTQQQGIMVDMNEQLATLRAPRQMQEYLSSLESIIKQYRKFEGAAASVKELADAQEYLTRSLENYEYNMETQLAQDHEQAINDALQLEELLWQRKEMLNQINNQIQGVLSQGVLTRQRTRAQTAGQQIQDIQYNAARQMEQLNEQIQAAQYRVDAESKIFNIATTRVGLEMQLLQSQNEQTNRDMLRIQALTTLVSAMQSGNLNDLSVVQDLLNAIPGVTNTITAPSAGNSNTPPLDDLIAAAYQDRASLGYAAYRGQNL